MLKLPAAAFAMLFALGAAAAEDAIPKTAAAPAEAMQRLAALHGEWLAVTEMINTEGEWIEQHRDRVAFEPSLNGLLLTEKHIARISGQGFRVETDFSFDQYRAAYRAAATDDTWGLMDVYEGTADGDVLQITNIRSGTSFPLQDGREMHFRHTIPLSGETRIVTIEQSTDAGEKWSPFYRVIYTRPSATAQ